MGFKLGKETRKIRTSKTTPHIYRDKLDDGILGEAYNDGTIAVSVEVKPGSKKEKEVITHEMDHVKRMQSGELAYGVNYVKWKGGFYERKIDTDNPRIYDRFLNGMSYINELMKKSQQPPKLTKLKKNK